MKPQVSPVRLYLYWVLREKLKLAIKQGNMKVKHMFYIFNFTVINIWLVQCYLFKKESDAWIKFSIHLCES